MSKVPFTTPCGRLVGGSLTQAYQKKDDKGQVVLGTKPGDGFGKPILYYFFQLAVAKEAGQHWASTLAGVDIAKTPPDPRAWGALIWGAGHAGNPQAGQNPNFAWKIIDGDSQIPNGKGKKPCDNDGFPGHWILSFKCGWAPELWTIVGASNPSPITQPNVINLGDYVQVSASAEYNGNMQKPGVYLNHKMVCLIGHGVRISVGMDVASAGFGGVALPPGATLVPQGNFVAPPPTAGAPVGAPPAPNFLPAPSNVPGGGTIPSVPSAVAMPAPPQASPQRVMLAAAQGRTYEEFISSGQGWTDALLVQHQMMAPPAAAIPLPSPAGIAPPPSPVAPIAVVPNPAFVQQIAPPPEVMIEGRPLSAWLAAGWTVDSLRQQAKMG